MKNDIELYDSVSLGDDVFIFGYPKSIGLKGIPQFDYNKPLLRKGNIAAKYETKKTLILDAQVDHGNSGGPVFVLSLRRRDLELIGFVDQLIPYTGAIINQNGEIKGVATLSNSNYSVIVPIDHVLSLLKGFFGPPN